MKLAIVTTLLVAILSTAESDRVAIWYFASSGVPVGEMGSPAPASAGIPDVDGDGVPGRTLQAGDYQEFLGAGADIHIQGAPTVDIWARAARSDGVDGGGSLSVRLLECTPDGCTPLGATSLEVDRWGDSWTSYSVRLPEIDVVLGPESQVCVRFDPGPDTSVVLAYGSTATPGALLFPLAQETTVTPPDQEEAATPPSVPPPTTTTITPPDDRSDLIRPLQRDAAAISRGLEAVDLRDGLIGAVVLACSVLVGATLFRRR